jgi:hypothetical protein
MQPFLKLCELILFFSDDIFTVANILLLFSILLPIYYFTINLYTLS